MSSGVAEASSTPVLSWDLLADAQQLFAYHFMQNAFLAGALVALVAGAVGYFMVLRGQSFAGHALAQVGFAGAAAATVLGVPAELGLLVFALGGAVGLKALGHGGSGWRQDVATGTVLAFSLGLGLLFLRFSPGYSAGIYAILFGSVLGIGDGALGLMAITTFVILIGLTFIGRPLLFVSVDPVVASARGVPSRAVSGTFLILLALTVAQAAQITGTLLIFSLLVTPAAIARQLTVRPGRAVALGIGLALPFTWTGLALSYFSPYPAGFFITSLAFGAYGLTRLARVAFRRRVAPRGPTWELGH